MKISRMVYELEPFKDFILDSKVKVDLGGKRSLLRKLPSLMKNIVMKISRMVYKLEPCKDYILAS